MYHYSCPSRLLDFYFVLCYNNQKLLFRFHFLKYFSLLLFNSIAKNLFSFHSGKFDSTNIQECGSVETLCLSFDPIILDLIQKRICRIWIYLSYPGENWRFAVPNFAYLIINEKIADTRYCGLPFNSFIEISRYILK